ncbi:MAG TPA: RidA family protein [Devosiaceae bacterium]
MVRRISSGSPFEERIGYSRAVVDGGFVHVSGTTGYDYATMQMPEDAGRQASNALATIAGVLEEAGSNLGDVVRVRYYLADRADLDAVSVAAGAVFGSIRPAATMVIAQLIAPEMKIEIEVTARIGAGDD